MLFSDLTLIVIIMVCSILRNQSIAENEVLKGRKHPYSSRTILKDWQYKKEKLHEVMKRTRRPKISQRRDWYLDPVLIKLNNVIEKYEVKRNVLEDVYMGVVGCGLSRCEKFKGLIPENQRLRHIHCFKQQNGFTKMVSDLLMAFHNGIQRVDKSFGSLISFEKWPHLNNRSRRKILEEFKIDIKTLNVEVETAMTNKILNSDREPEVPVSSYFQRPENQTHLMIYEWRIIQASRKFLRDWQKNLKKILKCWKKRQKKRQKKRERMKNGFNSRRGRTNAIYKISGNGVNEQLQKIVWTRDNLN